MNWKIFSLISLLALSIPATFAENSQLTDTESQQMVDSTNQPLTITHLPITQISRRPLLNCQRNNIQKVIDNSSIALTMSDSDINVLVELKNDGNVKRIQTSGRNNDVVVKSLKKSVFRAAPFVMPKDEAEIHLCSKFEFNFYRHLPPL
ncbi:hypothetical protein [uncultured Acinetobacter sp.]|uniref:hypothetical protein n=1 Tax=uncultured Acinetobacter sp. TaxID=165433 RepID=UPI0025E868D6|nr:hypothetical protein [uncultured Acinetobacter sp.]